MSDFDPAMGQSFARQAEQIHELKLNLSRLLDSGGRDEAGARTLVELLLASGREWEAWSWAIMAQSKYPRASWVRDVLRQLADYPHTGSPRILAASDLTVKFDLSGYPDFRTLESMWNVTEASLPDVAAQETIRFDDQAERLGLEFTYHRGRVPGMEGVRMQESTGGGVGVLDYDNDGWPDVFLTQGEDWPAGANEPAGSSGYRDVLFRNLGGRFENTTILASFPEEDGYGQGCACGDFNNDGFADVYVANIGVNQLLINNGDGTFTDASSRAGLSQSLWTTSVVMADLNADGNPDLFDVNYVQGDELFQITCDETDCSPQAYDEAPDYAHLSLGDGTTRPVAPDPEARVGAGLGIVAFRVDRSLSPEGIDTPEAVNIEGLTPVESSLSRFSDGHLSLFIANDQDPNSFLRVVPSADPQNFALADESFIAGLAMNRDGNTAACMGVAAGDVTGDGQLDLFVTNYKDEANSLYAQEDGGIFTDAIGGSGLLMAGLPYVGWGTQMLDADNDGRLDIVVTNGHVGEFARADGQYRMPTQFFRNSGDRRFRELLPGDLGSFFSRKVMGRSLATLDWNRDGRIDFVVSLLDENVTVLTNQTADRGNWLMLRLSGTTSARDAIGTFVTVITDGEVIRRQLTGGDGYQASNERVLHFGLGPDDVVMELVIEWPSGLTQTIHNVPANGLLLVTEGGGSVRFPAGM